MCDWGSLREQWGWGWDWKGRLILNGRWPPMAGAWLFPAVGGKMWLIPEQGSCPCLLNDFFLMLLWCECCQEPMTAAPVECTCSYAQERVHYQGVFCIPITLRLSPRNLEWLAATSEWGTSRAIMVGCWQGLVTSRLSGCSLVWKSLTWVQRCWGCSDGEERGQEAACVQREEKDSFLKLLSGLSPGKRQSGTLAEVASAFSLLLLTPDDWIPMSFLCLLGILFPGFSQFLFAGMSRDVAERKQGEVWWMLQVKWNLAFGWCSPQ